MFDVVADKCSLYSKRHGGPVVQLAWHVQHQQEEQPNGEQPPARLVLLSLGGEGCLLCWPSIFPGARVVQAQPQDVGAQLQEQLCQGGLTHHAMQQMGAAAGSLSIVRWSCMAMQPAGAGMLAVGNADGQLLLLRQRACPSNPGAAAAAGQPQGSSSNGSWRRAQPLPNTGRSSSSGSPAWQALRCVATACAQALVAAAWQPEPATGNNMAAAAADAAGASVQQHTNLLAAIDKHHVHLIAPATEAAGGSSGSPRSDGALLCFVRVANPEQQQLLAVAWSDAGTLCVGGGDGSCQVIKVRQGEGSCCCYC